MQTITKLTKAEKNRIYRACELVESGLEFHSCNAIYCLSNYKFKKLRLEYASFYKNESESDWDIDFNEDGSYYAKAKSLRVILLLLFAEVGKIEGEC